MTRQENAQDEPDWVCFGEVDDDPRCNDDDGSHRETRELMEMEWEDEEESLRAIVSEMSDYADSWARADDEGWFYRDDD